MPGKHAPKSPLSFYLSLARFGFMVAAVAAIMVTIGVVAFGGGGNEPERAAGTSSPTASATADPTDTSGPIIEESPEPTVEPTPTPTATETPDFTQTTLPPSQVTVEVLNGTDRAGLARSTAQKVRSAGYRVENVGNAKAVPKSVIIYLPGAEDEARALQDQFAEFTELREGKPGEGAIIRMVIGADYPED